MCLMRPKQNLFCFVCFFLKYEAARNMYSSYIYSVISYCIRAWRSVSRCTSRCDGLKIIRKTIVKNLFSKISQNDSCIFRQARILILDHIYKLNVTSYIFNILKYGKYPTLRSSLYMSYPSYSYYTQKKVITCCYPTLGLKPFG